MGGRPSSLCVSGRGGAGVVVPSALVQGLVPFGPLVELGALRGREGVLGGRVCPPAVPCLGRRRAPLSPLDSSLCDGLERVVLRAVPRAVRAQQQDEQLNLWMWKWSVSPAACRPSLVKLSPMATGRIVAKEGGAPAACVIVDALRLNELVLLPRWMQTSSSPSAGCRRSRAMVLLSKGPVEPARGKQASPSPLCVRPGSRGLS